MKHSLLVLVFSAAHCFAGWTVQQSGTVATLNSVTVHHGQDDIAWICGDAGTILHTTNGGFELDFTK
ncbi:MAG: hypothetical protein ACKVRP_13950 [Bacteroidota bacterium]